jgi:hypothetical protein
MSVYVHAHDRLKRHGVGAPAKPRHASILDDLVIQALQPLSILQIGVRGQLLDKWGKVAVRKAGSLDEAVCAVVRHEEFDAIVLGADVGDAWPTAAYERIAELAGPTPVVVQAGFVEPMARIKQQQIREGDTIVATANPDLLGRLALTAILRSRALAEEPKTEIG